MTVYDNEIGYWERRLGEDVPLNSVGYYGLSDAYVAWLYKIRAKRFTAIAAPLVTPALEVLDVGSGGGFYVDLWQRLGVARITATDLTQASVRAIRRRFPSADAVAFDVGGTTIPFEPQSFDAVSCMDVLHHLMDDDAYERALENISTLLRPNGHVIFTDNFLHGQAYRGPHHVSRPLTEIERALERAGLTIVRRRPLFVLMNNPVDSPHRLFKFYWKVVSFISENPRVGAFTGAALYPVELALTSLMREGPSTEICVARKR